MQKKKIYPSLLGLLLGFGTNLFTSSINLFPDWVSITSILCLSIGTIGAIISLFLANNVENKVGRQLFFIMASLVSFIFVAYKIYQIYTFNVSIETTSIMFSLLFGGLFSLLERMSQMMG